jgi:hypothetical protein
MDTAIRWLKIFGVMFPAVMILNQCGYNNCYRAYCLAAAFGPVTLMTLFLSLGVLVVYTLIDRR